MNINRILSGSPEHRTELIAAGIFVALWFAMDLAQWVDWVASKVHPGAQMMCLPITAPTVPCLDSKGCSLFVAPAKKR